MKTSTNKGIKTTLQVMHSLAVHSKFSLTPNQPLITEKTSGSLTRNNIVQLSNTVYSVYGCYLYPASYSLLPTLSQWHTWRFYTPIAVNLITSENRKQASHVIKSPNLTGWLYRQCTAMSVENCGNRHTWWMLANLIANIWYARYRWFYTPITVNGL